MVAEESDSAQKKKKETERTFKNSNEEQLTETLKVIKVPPVIIENLFVQLTNIIAELFY